ncbi:MAG: hypothetical protein KGI50_01615 [Patescibacteria group bacterium]|nr:hypothetical protein [Patescibacteria group bacterium]MDE2437959.1 hypothetical protein [Patescibacteria group bacterium]
MREKGDWSAVSYASTMKEVATRGGGSSTYAGEQRVREGKGLDPLVDPRMYDVIRSSNNLLVPRDDGAFTLEFGVAMPVETDLDTTGSMGRNVDVAFSVLPKVQNLLVQGENAVLRRYHTQIATGVIQDQIDRFPYQRSQFEPDNEVERQMGLFVPEKNGGDVIEDYQLSLFALTYLTRTSIAEYGLKGYFFVLGDERGRDRTEAALLARVFGPDVFQKAFGSPQQREFPSLKEIGKKAVKDWHVFFLQVGSNVEAANWWSAILGRERVIKLPRTEDVAEIQACIIGLTEGVLDLQSAGDFLETAKVSRERARKVVDVLRGIPLGLQKTYANFDRIPKPGAVFASREDIWPVGGKNKVAKKDSAAAKPGANADDESWQL